MGTQTALKTEVRNGKDGLKLICSLDLVEYIQHYLFRQRFNATTITASIACINRLLSSRSTTSPNNKENVVT